jgi:mRNA interferase MazF
MIKEPFQWQVAMAMATLDPVRGSEQAGRRPVLIVSNEPINQALPIVSVLPISTHRFGSPNDFP